MSDELRSVSHSRATTFRRCTYRYSELYLGEKADYGKSPGLATGSAGHAALKAYYLGKPKQVAIDWAYEEAAPKNEAEQADFERLVKVLAHYWQSTVTDRWKVEEVERELRVGRLHGILDLIVKTPEGLRLIVDHKFQKSTQVSHLATDNQVSMYLLLAAQASIKVDGMMYNIIPTGGNGATFAKPIRKVVTRSPNYLNNFYRELMQQVAIMDRFDAQPEPLRNFTRDCSWDCPIYQLCLDRMEGRQNGK